MKPLQNPQVPRKKRLLVTGASGLLGSTALVELRPHFQVFGTYLRHVIEWEGTACHPADLSDPRQAEELLARTEPEIILHTAASVNVDDCELRKENAFRANVTATENLARWAGQMGALLAYVSTDAFFESADPAKQFTEEDSPTPLNYYGETKLLGEVAVKKHAPRHLILRTNIYGWNYQDKLCFAEWAHSLLSQGKPTPLVYDVFFSPCLNQTFLAYFRALVDGNAQGLYHVAGARSLSKLDFGRLLCETFQLDESCVVPSSVTSLQLKARRSNNMALSNRKLQEFLGTKLTSIEDDLAEFKRLKDSGYPGRLKTVYSRLNSAEIRA